jgi:glucose-1-phosphate cytidylyltransferase
VLRPAAEPWRITLVDTGEDTMTGGRLKRIARHVAGDDAFCMTYGDGVSTWTSALIDSTARIGGSRPSPP